MYQHHLEEKFLLKHNCNLIQMFARVGSLRVISMTARVKVKRQKSWARLRKCNCIIFSELSYNIKGLYHFSLLCCSHYLVPLPIRKWTCRVLEKISNNFHQGELTIIIIFVLSSFLQACVKSIKTWKRWPNFLKFQSISIRAIRTEQQAKEDSSVNA